ncbi:hypothetical protein BS78_09G113300 [Paspalum vaginatum]|nr:hypothetical protein BS78_09G113300 [Paspalum vaginatum]
MLTSAGSSFSTFQAERNVFWKPPLQLVHNTRSGPQSLMEVVYLTSGVHGTLHTVITFSEQYYVVLHLLITRENCMSWTLVLAQGELRTDDVSFVASDRHSYGLIISSYISLCFFEGLSETLYTWALLTAGLFSASSTLEDRQLECRQQMLWDSEILMFHAGFLASIQESKMVLIA